MTDDYNPLINTDRYKSRIDMSVIGPIKKFDPLPIPFQSVPIKSVPIETESEKIGTRLIGIGIGVTRYLDAFPNACVASGGPKPHNAPITLRPETQWK